MSDPNDHLNDFPRSVPSQQDVADGLADSLRGLDDRFPLGPGVVVDQPGFASKTVFLKTQKDKTEEGLEESLKGLNGKPVQRGYIALTHGRSGRDAKMTMIGNIGTMRLHISAQNILTTRTDTIFMPQFPHVPNESGIAGQSIAQTGSREPIEAYEALRARRQPGYGEAFLTAYTAKRRNNTALEAPYRAESNADHLYREKMARLPEGSEDKSDSPIDPGSFGSAAPHRTHSVIHTVTARKYGAMNEFQRIIYRREQFFDVKSAILTGIRKIAAYNAALPEDSPLRIRDIAIPLLGSGGDGTLTPIQSANAILKTLELHQAELEAAGITKITLCAFSPPLATDKTKDDYMKRSNALVSQIAHIYEYASYRHTGKISGTKEWSEKDSLAAYHATHAPVSIVGADTHPAINEKKVGGEEDGQEPAGNPTAAVRMKKIRPSNPADYGKRRRGGRSPDYELLR